MTITVLDCSHWNTITDWAALRGAGVAGMIHKFSQGVGYHDPKFAERRFAASGSGMLFGRYHFGDASRVTSQVDNFLKGWDQSEALALDWEDNKASQMTIMQAEAFATQVLHRTGVWPLLYTGNTLKDALARGEAPGALLHCRLWLAQWSGAVVLPAGWPSWWLWQHSSEGTVAGITGHVDLNAFSGTAAELCAGWTGAQAVARV